LGLPTRHSNSATPCPGTGFFLCKLLCKSAHPPLPTPPSSVCFPQNRPLLNHAGFFFPSSLATEVRKEKGKKRRQAPHSKAPLYHPVASRSRDKLAAHPHGLRYNPRHDNPAIPVPPTCGKGATLLAPAPRRGRQRPGPGGAARRVLRAPRPQRAPARTTTIENPRRSSCPATSGAVEILGRRWGQDDDALRQRLGITLQGRRAWPRKLTTREDADALPQLLRPGPLPSVRARRGRPDREGGRFTSAKPVGRAAAAPGRLACALVGDPETAVPRRADDRAGPAVRAAPCGNILRRLQRAGGRTVSSSRPHYMDESRAAVRPGWRSWNHGRPDRAGGRPAELIARPGRRAPESSFVAKRRSAGRGGLAPALPGVVGGAARGTTGATSWRWTAPHVYGCQRCWSGLPARGP